jgi:hypothetical protein
MPVKAQHQVKWGNAKNGQSRHHLLVSHQLEKERQTEDNIQPRHHVYVVRYYSSAHARVIRLC